MKIVRFYLAAVAITIAEFIIGFLSCGYLFRWVYKIPPANIWKPAMHGAPTKEYYIGIF